MARPLTKGPPIGFRLPLDMDALLRKQAAAANTPVNVYVAERVAVWLRGFDAGQRASKLTPPVEVPGCPHTDRREGSWLWECNSCGLTSNNRGQSWR